MAKAKRPKLGSHLEWHGATIRVVVRVPPSKVTELGKGKLKEALATSSPRDAEALKWPVVAKLKAQITGAGGPTRSSDRLIKEAFQWREAIRHEDQRVAAGDLTEESAAARSALDDRVETLDPRLPRTRRDLFTSIATGVATPVAHFVDPWLGEAEYAPRTAEAYRHAVRSLAAWLAEANITPSLETITRKVAGRFVSEHFIARATNPATANKVVGGLRLYWTWLARKGHVEGDNPWTDQSVRDKARERRAARRDPGEGDKRPFTDAEAATLLQGVTDPLLADFCRVAALTGMRRDEIATLRVRHVQGDTMKLAGTKTAAAVREVPVHPDLADLIARRIAGKAPDGYVFQELPDQTNAARGRGAPITQAFTRARRKLGVDDQPEGSRQGRIDLHSWRRWFIRQAVTALEGGATGFTAWTIADVVGHSKEDGPLAMTMGRYPGRADTKALRACVEAVRLPATE